MKSMRVNTKLVLTDRKKTLQHLLCRSLSVCRAYKSAAGVLRGWSDNTIDAQWSIAKCALCEWGWGVCETHFTTDWIPLSFLCPPHHGQPSDQVGRRRHPSADAAKSNRIAAEGAGQRLTWAVTRYIGFRNRSSLCNTPWTVCLLRRPRLVG